MLLFKRSLRLNAQQAEYVRDLFLAGTPPEEIGRGMDKFVGRRSFKYFMVPKEKGFGWEWPENVDYEIDGLEYLRAAMVKLGAIVVRRDGDYYQTAHPMVQKLAGIASNAAVPVRKEIRNGETA